MAEIQHIVWDWNGTLLDDVDACVEAINCMMARRGLGSLERSRYIDIFEFPVRNYYHRLGFDLENEDWDAMAVEFHAHYDRTAREAGLRSGTRALLGALGEQGVRMSVLSACEENILARMMAERGIDSCFTSVHGLSHLHATSKIDVGHELLSGLALDPAGVLLIGDTAHDYEVATALGCRCVLVSGGHQSVRRLEACGCDVLAGMAELGPYVRESTLDN